VPSNCQHDLRVRSSVTLNMSATLAYVAASTNRFSNTADVSPSSSAIVFGSSRLLALWHVDVSLAKRKVPANMILNFYQDPNDHGVSQTLPGHDGFIKCVKFMKDDMIVSADTKGTLRLWRKNISQAGKGFSLGLMRANDIKQWKAHCTIQAHSESISCLFVEGEYLVTGSSDSCVKIWKVTVEDKSDISGFHLSILYAHIMISYFNNRRPCRRSNHRLE
jgi:elongator complex protein 2